MEKSPTPERQAVLYRDNERVVLDLSNAGGLIYPFAEWQKQEAELAASMSPARVIPFSERPLP